MLAAGSKVNAIDNAAMTALHIAAENDNVTLEKIKLLVEAGVNVHALDSDGLTALDYAKTRTGDDASSVVNYLTVVDLVQLIEAWNNGIGAEDLDGDGNVGVNDLLTLIAAWGDMV